MVPPPRLVSLDGRATPQFRVMPPDYTGLTPADLPDGTTELMLPTGPIPAGTTIAMRGATDVRLSVRGSHVLGRSLRVERASPLAALGHLNPIAAIVAGSLAESIGADIPLTLDSSGRSLLGDLHAVDARRLCAAAHGRDRLDGDAGRSTSPGRATRCRSSRWPDPRPVAIRSY